MDIVFDPPGSGMFNEVYLYEELMEADLHAIVSKVHNCELTSRSGQDSLCQTHTSRALFTKRSVVSSTSILRMSSTVT